MRRDPIGSYQTYPKYRESGVEWLGKIPADWDVIDLKYLADVRLSNVDKRTVEGEQSVKLCNYLDVYNNEQITSEIPFMDATATDEQVKRLSLRPDDVVLTKDSEDPADIGVSAHVPNAISNLVCGYHLAIARPRASSGAFIAYMLRSTYVREVFRVSSNGLTRYALGKYAIENTLVPRPPIAEQRAIAAFLDREISRVDTLIEKQQRLIGLLNEKRQAVISQAVRQGLNPIVPMKDSGVEWLGEVPRHWEVKPLKRITSFVTSGSRGWAEYYSDHGAIFIRIANLTRFGVDLDLSSIQYVQLPATGAECDRSRAICGDIVISITADLGSVACVPPLPHDAYVSQHVALARPLKKTCSRWLAYAVRSDASKEQLNQSAYGGTKIQLSLSDISNLWIATPDLTEQLAIAEFLDRDTAKIDMLMSKARKSIELMHERRSALISATVTGKIDVREAATT